MDKEQGKGQANGKRQAEDVGGRTSGEGSEKAKRQKKNQEPEASSWQKALEWARHPPLDPLGIFSDLDKGLRFGKLQSSMTYNNLMGRQTLYDCFEAQSFSQGNKSFLHFEDTVYSWNESARAANQIAHYFKDTVGVKVGDVVAVVVPNKPQFIFIWMGLLAIGATPAFINHALTGESLMHCIKISDSKRVLFDADVVEQIKEVRKQLDEEKFELLEWADGNHSKERKSSLGQGWTVVSKKVIASQSIERIKSEYRKEVTPKSPACYIYTSGTSGLPKAAPCSHVKAITAARTWASFNSFSSTDTVYTALPLYHSSAAFLCISASFMAGCSVALSRKFSASKFWKEVARHKATVIQYIGEICRYLLGKEPSKEDKSHRVRLAYGNGMRPEVWERFRKRFGIKHISEFYASTEGNTFLFNYNTGPFGAGAIGRESGLAAMITGNVIVKVDPETQEPVRNSSGKCVMAAYNEPGELLSRIDSFIAAKEFQGYKGNNDATSKKTINNVIFKNDTYFRTGDLLSKDICGFYYFVDRVGDTFRWKSENVSTAEVNSALASFEGLDTVNVYGVELPNHDGRAGCATITRAEFKKLDLKALLSHASNKLPKYAVPVFLRVIEKQDETGTMKAVTTRYRKEGVDPEQVDDDDEIYWQRDGSYAKFEEKDWQALCDGEISL